MEWDGKTHTDADPIEVASNSPLIALETAVYNVVSTATISEIRILGKSFPLSRPVFTISCSQIVYSAGLNITCCDLKHCEYTFIVSCKLILQFLIYLSKIIQLWIH